MASDTLRNANFDHGLIAASSDGLFSTVLLWADPTTHALLTSSIPGTGATNLGKAEDAPHTSGDVGVEMLAVYQSTPTQLAGTSGDYSVLSTDANGALYENMAYKLDSTNDSVTASNLTGNVASGGTDSGSPVKVGAVYNSTKPTFTNAQRGDLQIGTRGSLAVSLFATDTTSAPVGVTGNAVPAAIMYAGMSNGGNSVGLSTIPNADGTGNSQVLLTAAASWNGSSYDRPRGNVTGAVVAAGTTSTQSNQALTTFNNTKLLIVVNVSAVSGGTVTVTITGTTSTGYDYPILVSTALGSIAVTPLRVAPGLTASPNAVANDIIPRNLKITATVSGTITYGIDYILSL